VEEHAPEVLRGRVDFAEGTGGERRDREEDEGEEGGEV